MWEVVVGPGRAPPRDGRRTRLVGVAADSPWLSRPVAALARELTAGLRAAGLGVTLSDVLSRLDRDASGLVALVDELLAAVPGAPRTRCC